MGRSSCLLRIPSGVDCAGQETANPQGGRRAAQNEARGRKPVTGPEAFYGAVHGKKATANNPVIPLKWQGLVSARSVFSPTGPAPKKGQTHTFKTSAGNLAVRVTAKPTNRQTVSPKACHFAFSTDIVFTVLGGRSTGKFAGASGPGAVQLYEAGCGARFKSGPNKGKCKPNGAELAKGAVAQFTGSAVLTAP